MHLHQYTNDPINQVETLLMQSRQLLESLLQAASQLEDADQDAAIYTKLRHLSNTVEMLSDLLLGYSWATDGMLQVIAQLVDSGAITESAAQRISGVADEHLGDSFVVGAMASRNG